MFDLDNCTNTYIFKTLKYDQGAVALFADKAHNLIIKVEPIFGFQSKLVI